MLTFAAVCGPARVTDTDWGRGRHQWRRLVADLTPRTPPGQPAQDLPLMG